MFKKYAGFHFIFLLLTVIQLITESDTLTQIFLVKGIHYFSKPLLVISLFGLLLYQTGLRGRFSKRIAIGLIFSLIGDSCLLFEKQNSAFLIAGIFAFVIAFLLYAAAFNLDYRLNTSIYKGHRKNAIMAFLFYDLALYSALWSGLDMPMKIAVLFCLLALSFAGIMAVNRFGRVNSLSYKLHLMGIGSFALSIIVFMINRYLVNFSLSGIFVTACYIAAQYLIVMGTLERKLKKKVEEI